MLRRLPDLRLSPMTCVAAAAGEFLSTGLESIGGVRRRAAAGLKATNVELRRNIGRISAEFTALPGR